MKLNSILLVDDDRICNYLHEKAIRKINIAKEIKIAFNGAEALEIINQYISLHHKLPELILLDLKMPVMDGFEFLKIFQEKKLHSISKTLIIVLTTSVHPQDIQKVSEVKNAVISTKPLTEEKLNFIYQKYITKIDAGVNQNEISESALKENNL